MGSMMRGLLYILALFAVLFPCSCGRLGGLSCSGRPCKEQGLMDQAMGLVKERKYKEAHELYKKVLDVCPGWSEALFRAGVVEYILGDYEQAVKHLSAAAKKDPSNADIWSRLGEACMQAKRYKEAARAYERAFRAVPRSEFREKQGRAELLAGDAKKARKVFESVVLEDPTSYGSLFFLGNIWRDEGHAEKASRYYEAAIKIRPVLVEAYINLASIRYSQGRYQDAVDLLERAMKEVPMDAPSDPSVRYNLGLSYLKLGNNEKAREHFGAFIVLSPEGKNAKEVKGILERLSGAEGKDGGNENR